MLQLPPATTTAGPAAAAACPTPASNRGPPPSSERLPKAPPAEAAAGAVLKLQVRSLDPTVFHIETEPTATILSIKQSIMAARGIDTIMQKLICKGALLADDSRVDECRITEDDFLVLVTAKPRPPSLVSTGAPLPSSYQSHLHGAGSGLVGGEDEVDGDDPDAPHELDGDGEGDGEDDEGEGEGEETLDGLSARCDAAEAADEVSRLVEMGYDARDADHAMRVSPPPHPLHTPSTPPPHAD